MGSTAVGFGVGEIGALLVLPAVGDGVPVAVVASGAGVLACPPVEPPEDDGDEEADDADEIGRETTSAYDWGPPCTRSFAADTRTVQVPAVRSETGRTMRSTLLVVSREHEPSFPEHFPNLTVGRGKGFR